MAPWWSPPNFCVARKILARVAEIATFRVEQESVCHECWPWRSSGGWRPGTDAGTSTTATFFSSKSCANLEQDVEGASSNPAAARCKQFAVHSLPIWCRCRIGSWAMPFAFSWSRPIGPRHATGIPIDLNQLPSNISSCYMHAHNLVVRGDAFVDVAGAVRLRVQQREMANSIRFLYSSAGIVMPPDANSSISRTIDRPV